MSIIVPNEDAQVNLGLLITYHTVFTPYAKKLFEYSGPATPDTDNLIKSSRLWLQHMIDILPVLMEAINDTPTSDGK